MRDLKLEDLGKPLPDNCPETVVSHVCCFKLFSFGGNFKAAIDN